MLLTIGLCSSYVYMRHAHKAGIKTIVIDAGHGGKDPGCTYYGLKEKDITLDVSLKLGEMLSANMDGIKIIYTRTKDEFVELKERAEIANRAKADLFISVHVNAAPPNGVKKMHGTETFVMGLHKSEQNLEVAQRENAAILLEKDSKVNYNGFDPKSPQSYILFSMYQNAKEVL